VPLCQAGNRVRLILAPGAHNQSKPFPTPVSAVAQAKTWYESITQGEVCTTCELVKRTSFNEDYVSRILDLAVLSPEMTETIFGGDHDPSLTVAQLIASLEIDWTRQGLTPDRRFRTESETS
jgi:hypothetical protein